ncbi:hypothetical protein [Rhodohalobacter sulfatireducens]|uniref:Uncharacterized protein n=1 Tax=Rhodohalobacter sulfatireducens TaxID=2911366 RepID=A0ABS9KF77_9BACT|nr:hypothetical protein [Rhodohalobacter sulfatireducens]MCG2589519.1 hypothetical protein [Rhodohalobacter sulfatireducens]
MFNYYLFEESYSNASRNDLEDCFNELNHIHVIESKDDDNFLMSDDFWNVETQLGPLSEVVFSSKLDEQLSRSILPRLFGTLNNVERINDLGQFDNDYEIYNAFFGIEIHDIPPDRFVRNRIEYQQFRKTNLWDVDHNNFWDRKESLFPNLVFCDGVKDQVEKLGTGKYFGQVVDILKEFDEANDGWSKGAFSYKEINNRSALNISPESKRTMDKYGNQRNFQLPDGSTESFELHIKTGDLRFHFFPNNDTKEIFIGYIGKHLSTVTDK